MPRLQLRTLPKVMSNGDSPRKRTILATATLRTSRPVDSFLPPNSSSDTDVDSAMRAPEPRHDEPTVHASTMLGLQNLSGVLGSKSSTAFGLHAMLDDITEFGDPAPGAGGFERNPRGNTGVRAALRQMDDEWLDVMASYLRGSEASRALAVADDKTPVPSRGQHAVIVTPRNPDSMSAGIVRRPVRRKKANLEPAAGPVTAVNPLNEEAPEPPHSDPVPLQVSEHDQVTLTVDVSATLQKQRVAQAYLETFRDLRSPAVETRPAGANSAPSTTAQSSDAHGPERVPIEPGSTQPLIDVRDSNTLNAARTDSIAPSGNTSTPAHVRTAAMSPISLRAATVPDTRSPLNSSPGSDPTVAGVHARRERWASGSWSESGKHDELAPAAAVRRRVNSAGDEPPQHSDPVDSDTSDVFDVLNQSDVNVPLIERADAANAPLPVAFPPPPVASAPPTPAASAPPTPRASAPPPPVPLTSASNPTTLLSPLQAASSSVMDSEPPMNADLLLEMAPAAQAAIRSTGAPMAALPDPNERRPRSGDSNFAIAIGGLAIIAVLFFFIWRFMGL